MAILAQALVPAGPALCAGWHMRRAYRFGSAHCRRCGDWDIHPCWKCHGTTLPPGPRFQHYVLDSEGNLWTTVCCGCDLAEGLEFVLEHYRTVQEVRLAVATELRRYWARRREVPPPPPGPIPAAGPKPPPPPPPRSIWAQGLAAGSRLQTRSPPAVRPFVPQDPSGLAEHGW